MKKIATAYCFASGEIEFTAGGLPSGALPIARGPEKKLKDWIDGNARHGYKTRLIDGRPTKIPGSDNLLVPGIPEASDQHEGLDALYRFCKFIRPSAPAGVTLLA
jgi:hypothetical protein